MNVPRGLIQREHFMLSTNKVGVHNSLNDPTSSFLHSTFFPSNFHTHSPERLKNAAWDSQEILFFLRKISSCHT